MIKNYFCLFCTQNNFLTVGVSTILFSSINLTLVLKLLYENSEVIEFLLKVLKSLSSVKL